MSTNETEDESNEIEELEDVHAVLGTEIRPDPRYGEVTEAVFDPAVIEEWVYDELIQAIRGDGFALVAFGTTSEGDAERMVQDGNLTEEAAEVALGAPKGVFVYRGAPE